jgi:hypothetical protein
MDAGKLMIIKRANKGEAVLVTYNGVFSANVNMIAKRTEINNRVILIMGYDEIVKTVLNGLTSTQTLNCLLMGGQGIIIVSQMIEYYTAPATANPDKLGQIKFTLTELIKGAKGDVYDRNSAVSNMFHSCVADMILKFYPVTTLMDTNYSTAILNYDDSTTGWADGEVIREAANEQMAIECKILTNSNFPSMKNFVFGYKVANAMFNSQIIIAYKSGSTVSRKKSIELHVAESLTGIDVVGYDVILVGSDGTRYPRIGGKKGLSLWNSLKTDVYTLILSRVGYIDKTITSIGYTAGKFIKIDTTMVIGVTPLMTEKVAKVAVVTAANDKDTVITEVEREKNEEEEETPETTEPTKD